MAVTAHAPPVSPARDVWHGRFGAPLALALVVLPFAVALMWAVTHPPPDAAALSERIRETAAVVEGTAASMIRIGERMAGSAEASTVADRAGWIAYGQHMIEDGRGLEALGERLRGTAAVAGADPMHSTNDVAVAVLQARWERLRADGRATAEHGRVMVRMASDVSAGIRSGIVTDADVAEIRATAERMVEAGARVERTAEVLLAETSLVQRWMGVGR
ncbi:MAG: hypothetical protein HYU87_11145 [Chloroflexi bacterium]|nr:hypothetical protein [Chloroflexota bacterium]